MAMPRQPPCEDTACHRAVRMPAALVHAHAATPPGVTSARGMIVAPPIAHLHRDCTEIAPRHRPPRASGSPATPYRVAQRLLRSDRMPRGRPPCKSVSLISRSHLETRPLAVTRRLPAARHAGARDHRAKLPTPSYHGTCPFPHPSPSPTRRRSGPTNVAFTPPSFTPPSFTPPLSSPWCPCARRVPPEWR